MEEAFIEQWAKIAATTPQTFNVAPGHSTGLAYLPSVVGKIDHRFSAWAQIFSKFV